LAAVCELRSRIAAERSDGYDGNYKQDVEHYAVLADRVDQQLTNFHGAGTATPDCLGNVVRVGDLLDAHTARPAVYTPKANAVVTKADVVNAIVEDPQYDDTTSEHEQFLEVLADDHRTESFDRRTARRPTRTIDTPNRGRPRHVRVTVRPHEHRARRITLAGPILRGSPPEAPQPAD